MTHRLIKFRNTLRIAGTLILARTFGRYRHSVAGFGVPDYAVYEWRGKLWAFPTAPLAND